MRLRILACLVVACSAAALRAQPPDAPARLLTGQDLFRLQYADDPQIVPDGGTVAYVRVSYDVMHDRAVHSIWLVEVATGAERPVAARRWRQQRARAGPADGTRLAYVSRQEGGKAQIYVYWRDSGATAKLSDLTDAPSELEWSPDGSSIAFLMFAPDEKAESRQGASEARGGAMGRAARGDHRRHLSRGWRGVPEGWLSARLRGGGDGGAPRPLTFGAFNESGPISWSPRRAIAVRDGQPARQLAARADEHGALRSDCCGMRRSGRSRIVPARTRRPRYRRTGRALPTSVSTTATSATRMHGCMSWTASPDRYAR